MKDNLLWKELMGGGRKNDNPVLERLYKGNRSAYESIRELVQKNRILPFIGAGFSAEVYPSWSRFLLDIAVAYPDCEKAVSECIAQGQYEEAAEILCGEMTEFYFKKEISQTFGKNTLAGKWENISSSRKKLDEIFRCSMITTNYDRVLETIYHHELEVVCPHTEYQRPLLDNILHSNQPSLIKLHGDIEDISHIVITKDDYEKVYGSSAVQEAQGILVPMLKRILESRIVLFLGCSLCSDRTMQVLLDSAGETRQYYALAELPKETENPEDPFWPHLVDENGSENPTYRKRRQFMGDHHINCIWYPYGMYGALDAFLRELYKEVCPAKIPADPAKGSLAVKRKIVGRDNAIRELDEMFRTQDKIIFVTGTGGIGKTELCSSVIDRHPDLLIPYIELFGVNSLEAFCAKVATAIGYGDLPETNDINGNWNLLADAMLDGAKRCYGLYLDNWEDLWIGLEGNEEKRLRLLGWMEGLVSYGVKVMVSSRVQPREYDFAIYTYPLEPLDGNEGYDSQLFCRVYREKGGKLEPEGREYHDVLKKLGGHPLSIVLVATFAAAKTSWESVLKTWTKAEKKGKNERHNSLRTALGISWEALSEETVCREIWGVLALCIDNPQMKFLSEVVQCGEEECEKALEILYDSSMISWGDQGAVVMLPPVKEVFFQLASQEEIEWALKRHGAFIGSLIEKTSLASKDRYFWHSLLIDMLPQIYYVMVKMMELDLLGETIEGLCYGLGDYYFFNKIQSLDFLEKCLVFVRGKKQNRLAAFVLSHCGDLKNCLGEPDGAEKLYGEAEELYRGEGDNLGLANVLRSMGDLENRLGNLDGAEELYGEAEELYRCERSNLGLANVLQGKGDLKYRLGERKEAMKLYEEAEKLYRCEQANLGLANVLQSKGELKRCLGDLDEAERLYEEAEKLHRGERDNLGLANVLRSKGDLKSQLGDWDGAMKLYEEAEELYRDEQDNLGLANVLRSRGNLKNRLGDLDGAMKLHEEAEELYRGERLNLGLAYVFQNKGDIFIEQGKLHEAVEIYERALLLYQDEKDIMGYAYTMSELCCAYSLCADSEKASKIITELNQISDQIPYKDVKGYIRNRIQEANKILKNLP